MQSSPSYCQMQDSQDKKHPHQNTGDRCSEICRSEISNLTRVPQHIRMVTWIHEALSFSLFPSLARRRPIAGPTSKTSSTAFVAIVATAATVLVIIAAGATILSLARVVSATSTTVVVLIVVLVLIVATPTVTYRSIGESDVLRPGDLQSRP